MSKETKIDISSTVVEKGIDAARGFLESLIKPAVEEVGLLLKEKLTIWRLKNQVKVLNKAKEYCEKNNISVKSISLKLLTPLLENASLEEDETLQDKWAILLSNLVDSEQNIQNHVFPYLLSQISLKEFTVLETIWKSTQSKNERLRMTLEKINEDRENDAPELLSKIKQLDSEISTLSYSSDFEKWNKLSHEKINLGNKLSSFDAREKAAIEGLSKPVFIQDHELEAYEIANLIRLGIVKALSNPYAYVNRHSIPNDPHAENFEITDMEIQIEHNEDDYILSELGELFVQACLEKKR